MNEQIDLAEFLVIAERVLGIDAKVLKSAAKLGAAESALAAPFMGFGDTAGLTFTHPEGGQDETADVIEALAASELAEEAFVGWVKARTSR